MGVISIQRTFKVMGLGGSEKSECRERRVPRIESWTTTTGRILGIEEKPEMEKNRRLDSVVSESPNEENV